MTHQGRVLFVIPWGERVILGTTDTDYAGRPRPSAPSRTTKTTSCRLPTAPFPPPDSGYEDVIGRWAGLRPLIAGRGRPSDISRAHQIRMSEPGWLDVAGGKLTTYRLIAQQAVDRLLPHLERPASRCRTAEEPLLAPDETATAGGILPPPVGAEVVRHFCQQEWRCTWTT